MGEIEVFDIPLENIELVSYTYDLNLQVVEVEKRDKTKDDDVFRSIILEQ